jgi:archaellum biogenesis ATPase FlaH
MQLQKASRKKVKINLGLQGPSGSGKTFSSLLIAYGLVGNLSRAAVIGTENHSADLYAHLGNYNSLSLESPYSPERYIEAIHKWLMAGMEVIIIDSISHEWEGNGGILDIHGNMTGKKVLILFFSLTVSHPNFILLDNIFPSADKYAA